MRTIRFLIFLITVLVSVHGLSGQTTFTFTYDDSGNRTDRTILLKKSTVITDTAAFMQQQVQEISENLGGHTIKNYPNPTRGILNIEIPQAIEEKALLRCYTLNGKMILETYVNNQNTIVDLNNQPAGIYILTIIIGDRKKDWKIIKD